MFAGAKQIQKFLDAWGKQEPGKPKTSSKPKICDLCGKGIGKEDSYYIGYTRHRILAFTCIEFNCKKWLIAKAFVKE